MTPDVVSPNKKHSRGYRNSNKVSRTPFGVHYSHLDPKALCIFTE